jgi:hypothetical protein
MAQMSLSQIQTELGRLEELRAALVHQATGMTDQDKIRALEDAQPKVKPKTAQAEALLQSGYGLTVKESEAIIKERDANPQTWPLEEYRKAQAMLAAYNATSRQPSSTRRGWQRGG